MLVTAVAAALLLLVAPLAPAHAWVASVSDGTLYFNPETAGPNQLTISLTAGVYTVTDLGESANPIQGTGCSIAVEPNTANCPDTGVTRIFSDLGGGDDSATITAPTPATLIGNVGNDTLNGGPAGDQLSGGLGSDTLDGGDGADEVRGADVTAEISPVGDSPNVVRGGPGNDFVYGGDAGDTLVDGGPGDDPRVSGGAGDDVAVTGGEGADVLTGGDGNDSLDGGPGNDEVGMLGTSLATAVPFERGNDTFAGGEGDDVLRPGTAALPDSDTVVGGPGTDTATYESRTAPVNLTLDGKRNDGLPGERDDLQTVERLVGGDGDDTLVGGPQAETLEGRNGDDNLFGKGNRDVLKGGGPGSRASDGEDYLDGGAADDAYLGGSEGDTLKSRGGGVDRSVACGGEPADFAISDRGDRLRGCDRKDTDPRDRPVLGRRAALGGADETFGFRASGTRRFVPLDVHVNAPNGSTVDATNSSVRVTTAVPGRAAASKKRKRRQRRQTGKFSGGRFKVNQRRGGLTDIALAGKTSCAGKTDSPRSSVFPSLKISFRHLLARTKGTFRTRGRYAAAISYGTIWLTEDFCDRTRISVRRGKVLVVDRHGRHLVRAGRQFVTK
jgi:Ca2+-binding RTX toxin-like protein